MLAGPWSEKSIYKYSFLPEGPKKLFLETASSLSKGLDDFPPPPPHTHTRPPHPRPPYLKVWSRHWKVPLSGGAFSCRSSNWVPRSLSNLLTSLSLCFLALPFVCDTKPVKFNVPVRADRLIVFLGGAVPSSKIRRAEMTYLKMNFIRNRRGLVFIASKFHIHLWIQSNMISEFFWVRKWSNITS